VALTLFGLAAAGSPPAFAQVAAPFVGAWKVSWQPDRRKYDAVMTVTENGGSWQTYAQSQVNPCVGREVPMKVETATSNEVKFLLQFAEAIPGCPNATVILKAAADGTVTGTRSKFELTLSRQ
jgi:hypothetical protein